MSETKKRVFFTQVVSLIVVISILYGKIIRSLSRNFFLQRERVFTKIFVLLCGSTSAVLIKIYSYIEFFPNNHIIHTLTHTQICSLIICVRMCIIRCVN